MAVTISLVVAAPGVSPALASTSTQLAAPSRLISTTIPKPSREVFGFALASSLTNASIGYPSWNFDLLSTVAFFGVHVNGSGQLVSDSGWTSWNSSALSSMVTLAHQHGTKVLLTIVLQDFSPNTPTMCAGLRNAATTVSATVAQVRAKGVDGVNIDYEGLDGSCGTSDSYWAQHAMSSFVAKMRSGLGSSYYLSVDTYASSAADGYGFFDPNGMKAYVDSFFVMAYDLEYSNWSYLPISCSRFCLGPTGPLTAYHYNDSSVVRQYSNLVGASKVLLGVPYYGRKACVGGPVPNAYPTSGVVADSYLDAVGEASYSQTQAGSYAVHREERSAGMERWDTWYNTTLGCTRELYFDDAVSLGRKYDLVNSTGLRGVGIWNLNYGGGAAELWGALASHFARCTGATITASPASPQNTGVRVVFTATAGGCSTPAYRFWIQAPGGAWRIVQDYSSVSTYTWTGTSTGGTYHVEADVRASSATVYDAVANMNFVLDPPCAAPSLAASPASPQGAGAAVTFTAATSRCPSPRYRFWILAPGSRWSMVQNYSPTATYTWKTAGYGPGAYQVEVDVRDVSTTAAYDAVKQVADVLTTCSGAKLATSLPSPQSPGASITLAGSATCNGTPQYRFWVKAPGGSWQIVQDYGAAATYAWNTAGKPNGWYGLEVDVRDAGSPAVYETVANLSYLVDRCSAARLTTDKASPQRAGTAVVVSARATCAGTPQYRFWVKAPGGSWKIAQDYSASSTFTWNTTGLATGTYSLEVDVRDAGSSQAYDTVANSTFALT
jgi:spore germination protein YaaH